MADQKKQKRYSFKAEVAPTFWAIGPAVGWTEHIIEISLDIGPICF